MGYIDKNRMPGGQVLHRGVIHWIVYVWPSLLIVLGAYLSALGSRGRLVVELELESSASLLS